MERVGFQPCLYSPVKSGRARFLGHAYGEGATTGNTTAHIERGFLDEALNASARSRSLRREDLHALRFIVRKREQRP